eukprot:10210855-Alexandrium_andersonii.AAC.1
MRRGTPAAPEPDALPPTGTQTALSAAWPHQVARQHAEFKTLVFARRTEQPPARSPAIVAHLVLGEQFPR